MPQLCDQALGAFDQQAPEPRWQSSADDKRRRQAKTKGPSC